MNELTIINGEPTRIYTLLFYQVYFPGTIFAIVSGNIGL